MTCPMFMLSEQNFVMASFIVNPAIAIVMKSAPRALGERAKGSRP